MGNNILLIVLFIYAFSRLKILSIILVEGNIHDSWMTHLSPGRMAYDECPFAEMNVIRIGDKKLQVS